MKFGMAALQAGPWLGPVNPRSQMNWLGVFHSSSSTLCLSHMTLGSQPPSAVSSLAQGWVGVESRRPGPARILRRLVLEHSILHTTNIPCLTVPRPLPSFVCIYRLYVCPSTEVYITHSDGLQWARTGGLQQASPCLIPTMTLWIKC